MHGLRGCNASNEIGIALQVNACTKNMNTFGFVGDLNGSPEVSCVYHSEEVRCCSCHRLDEHAAQHAAAPHVCARMLCQLSAMPMTNVVSVGMLMQNILACVCAADRAMIDVISCNCIRARTNSCATPNGQLWATAFSRMSCWSPARRPGRPHRIDAPVAGAACMLHMDCIVTSAWSSVS